MFPGPGWVPLMLRRREDSGPQVELAERFEKDVNQSRGPAASESDLLDEDAISLASSGSADSTLLAPGQDEEQLMADVGSESIRS